MRHYSQLLILAYLLVLTMIAGCGSSAPDNKPEQLPITVASQSKTFSSTGTIINLPENHIQIGLDLYSLSGASIFINGETGSVSDLSQGMVVTVKGTRISDDSSNSVNLDSIEFDAVLEGPVTSVDISGESFVILGVKVQTDELTIFEEFSLEALSAGNIVEVSGFKDSEGTLLATFAELKSLSFNSDNELEIEGMVQSLNESDQTFLIGSQLIDYSEAILRGLPNNRLSNDIFVEVKSTTGLVEDVIIASEVEGKNDNNNNEFDEFEVEGIVTRFEGISDFAINGIDVSANDSTVYENGSVSDVKLGVKLKAKGAINADSTLVAGVISFKQELTIKIEAILEELSLNEKNVTLLGIKVFIDELTILKDASELDVEALTLEQLNIGDFVELEAFVSDQQIIARKLERDDPEDEVILQGTIDSLSRPELLVLGVGVTTNSNTQFEDLLENIISADTFFNMIQSGDEIKVKGQFDSNLLMAESVEIQN